MKHSYRGATWEVQLVLEVFFPHSEFPFQNFLFMTSTMFLNIEIQESPGKFTSTIGLSYGHGYFNLVSENLAWQIALNTTTPMSFRGGEKAS